MRRPGRGDRRGEPLLHKEIDQFVEGAIARKKFVIVCTNALLLEKKMDLFKPSKWFSWSVHLDGGKQEHDVSVCQTGVYDRAVAAIAESKRRGFRTIINCTLFNNAEPEKVASFFDDVMAMGVDGISVSPGYAYERAPDQQHFLNRSKTKELFRGIFRRQGKVRGSGNGRSTSRPCFWTFLPAIRPSIARRGATRPGPISAGSARATCWVRATPRPSRS